MKNPLLTSQSLLHPQNLHRTKSKWQRKDAAGNWGQHDHFYSLVLLLRSSSRLRWRRLLCQQPQTRGHGRSPTSCSPQPSPEPHSQPLIASFCLSFRRNLLFYLREPSRLSDLCVSAFTPIAPPSNPILHPPLQSSPAASPHPPPATAAPPPSGPDSPYPSKAPSAPHPLVS